MPNFNGKLNDNPLERSWILKILTKEYLLKKTKRDTTYNFIFYRWWCILLKIRCGNFSLFLRERTQIFVEKQQITKNEITQFIFIFSTWIICKEWKERSTKNYVLFCLIVQGKCKKNSPITVGIRSSTSISRLFSYSAIVPATTTMRSVRCILKLCRYNLFYFSFSSCR